MRTATIAVPTPATAHGLRSTKRAHRPHAPSSGWPWSTNRAIELGLARTGKLVTSAALILMFAFLVLSSSPGYEIKVFGVGLAAGIIFDATVIRALLVPALMKLLGDANWWLPDWTRRALFLSEERSPKPEGRALEA